MATPTTANRNYPLPHPENELDTDVQRLVSALQAIDGDVASLLISVSQAALASHGHVIGDVTGLQAALNDKAAAGHTHAINDLTDVDITGAPAGRPLTTQVGGGVGIGPAPMTQAQVDAAISAAIAALADAAPATLDTLNELAAALGDDPNFAATMTAALGGKLDANAAVVAATPDTVVKRDPSGDIYGRYLRGDYMRMHHAASERASDTVFFSSDDEYIRKNTKAGFLASLGIGDPSQFVTATPYESPLTNMLVGASYSFSHGKPHAPIVVELWAECISTANGYNYGAPIGTQIQITNLPPSLVINRNDTTIEIQTGGSASSIVYGGITIGVISNSPTAANWDIFVRAY